jgi:hypothetical protein
MPNQQAADEELSTYYKPGYKPLKTVSEMNSK